MSVSTPGQGGTVPAKLAVVGQFTADRERLLIRGISPKEIRDRYFAAERTADGRIKAIDHGDNSVVGRSKADPYARIFGSELVMWDLFAAWWDWPKQSLGESERIAGRECTLVRSQTDVAASPVREVVSCVDLDGRLSLRTQFFGNKHQLIRTIMVEKTIRKEFGLKAAKRLSITGEGGTTSEVEIYGGDEHYAVSADTFTVLDSGSSIDQQ